ncbi:MAG TPA: HEAT repeat domain-containing protein, partial [Ktedonobacterales bacterium]
RRMIALGRQRDDESRALLAEMERGGFSERFLALYACFGSRNGAHAARALSDPSRTIRGLAIRLVAQLCDESQLAEVLATVPVQVRRRLLWKLTPQHQASVDAYLERLAQRGDEQQLYEFLPLGSREVVQRLATRVLQSRGKLNWSWLARLHPAETMALFQQWVSAAGTDGQSVIQEAQRLLSVLAPKQPDALLALVKTLLPRKLLNNVNLNPLAEQRPGELAELALHTDTNLTINFNALVGRLTSAQIIALYERGKLNRYPSWFAQVGRAQRLAVFRALERRFRAANSLLPTDLLEALPQEVRVEEARKLFANTNQTITYRLPYARLLPWEEVLPALTPSLHASVVSTRQMALQALIGALPRNRERLPEVLEILLTRRSEHDAVRFSMLEALAKLPATIWREEYLPALEQIARHALNDVGLSSRTQQALMNVLLKVLQSFPVWAIAQLVTVLRERGVAGVSISLASLNPIAAHELSIALRRELLETWLAQEKESDVLAVASWFTTHQVAMAFLVPFIQGALQQTRSQQEAERALDLLRRVPRRLTMFVPFLLEEDPSWITFPMISGYVLRRRQELLTPFLSLQPVSGRWGSGKKRVILPITQMLAWATASQQETLANALSAIILDETQESRTATQAIKMLAFLPAIGVGRLKALAEHPQSVIRTTALFTLGHLDTDEGYPILVEALQDARARIAIHVVRARLLALPTEEALKILRGIPLDRVTVAKEVMRLIGDLPGEVAYQELLTLEQHDDLHRDVRAALVRAISKDLKRAETWDVLDRAARSPDTEIALAPLVLRAQLPQEMLGQALTNRPGETIGGHLLRWLAVLLQHPKQAVWQSAVNFCASQKIVDMEQVILPRLLAILQAPGQQGKVEAAQALFLVSRAEDAALITQAMEILLPQRSLLSAVIQRLLYSASNASERLAAVLRLIMEVLARDPKTVSLQIQCALRFLPPAEIPGFLERLVKNGQFHADALAAAMNVVNNDLYRLPLEQLQTVEAALASSKNEHLRRLALAVLQLQARKQNNDWSDAMRERLRAYRADRSLLVAAAAEFTFVPGEGDEGDEDVDDDDGYDDYDDEDEDFDE